MVIFYIYVIVLYDVKYHITFHVINFTYIPNGYHCNNYSMLTNTTHNQMVSHSLETLSIIWYCKKVTALCDVTTRMTLNHKLSLFFLHGYTYITVTSITVNDTKPKHVFGGCRDKWRNSINPVRRNARKMWFGDCLNTLHHGILEFDTFILYYFHDTLKFARYNYST